jgi:hypothetical protein
MAKRRTSGIQRRERASSEALNRRIDAPSGMSLPDWRILAIGGVLLVGAIIVILVLLLGSGPNPDAGIQQADAGQTHVTTGIDCRHPASSAEATECGGSDPYSSLPATSGPHWGSPAGLDWGVYEAAQSETALIHNLEHGGIVIWYDADAVDAEGVAALEQYVRTQTAAGISGRFKFIVSPWGGQDPLPSPVVATSWRYLLELDTADTTAIDQFAREHYGIAPEPNGGPAPPAS